ncbi:AraC family transcriptional regulator [Pedobacter nototheniae]|uniref:helix-turn-helix transcriptional regulator n=1 Tax=Pedobacter nototheniae TaxID=2488994 RepID=UPI0029314DB2|nr:AraC family transcriptional regulator [Pedobacter nototheniae]
MALSIYDDFDQHYIVGNQLNNFELNQSLVTERKDIYSFPFGDAELVQIAFSGIYIVYGDMLVKNGRLRIKSFEEPELVEMHFSISGGGIMENYLTNKRLNIKPNQHNIIYTPDFDGIAEFPTDQKFKFFEVHFSKDRFVELTKDSSPLLMKFAENIMNNKSVEISKDNLPISLAMHSCINDVINCRVSGGLKLLFLQSKCVELLALQAQAFEMALKETNNTVVKTTYDKDRIYYAREYLLEHANQPPSLSELAKIAGINEFKLKHGFRETFQNSVFGYLGDHKMAQAKDLLSSGTCTIKQIADDLGYSSVQHFSHAFKKKFGVTPGKNKG